MGIDVLDTDDDASLAGSLRVVDDLDCHRTVLIARVVAEHGVAIDHIHGNGHIESQVLAMRRLMARFGLDEADLFHAPTERLEEALSRQEHRIAYFNKEFRLDGTLGR